MPGFDQKGPVGQGPMTGRRMGKCTNYGANQKSQPTENTSQNDDLERGFGFGRRGRGRGFGRGLGLQNRFRGNM
jgi:hypothetical protein